MKGNKKIRALLLAVYRPDAIGGQAECARMMLRNLPEVEWKAISFPLARRYLFFFRFLLSVKILLQSLWICMSGQVNSVHILTACGRAALFEKLIMIRVLGITGVTTCLYLHGAFDYYYSGFSDRDQRMIRRLMRKADKVICLHPAMKKYLTGNGITDEEKTEVIPNGVIIQPEITRQENRNEETRIAYLGMVAKDKGMDTLLEAVTILRSRMSTENFSVGITGPAGENGYMETLVESSKRNNISHLVHFHPPVFGDDKRNFFATADIFIFPSQHEGFPIVLLEAMEAGLPVVATDIIPMNEVITQDKNGLLFEMNSAEDLAARLLPLLNDREQRQRLGSEARKHIVENYSREKIISMYVELFSRL